MGISLASALFGLLVALAGIVLLVTRKARKLALVCLAAGAGLMVGPYLYIAWFIE